MEKLAVRKEPGHIPGGGFHYMLMPIRMENDAQAAMFELMGHIIIEVDKATADRFIKEAGQALHHQIEIAILADKAESAAVKLGGK